jgi:hypothetical protein
MVKLLKYVLTYVVLITGVSFAGCTRIQRMRCENSRYVRIGNVDVQIFKDDQTVIANLESVNGYFEPDRETINEALNEAIEKRVIKRNDFVFVQASGNRSIEGDSIIVFSVMYKHPPSSHDVCDIDIGIGGFYEKYAAYFTYRINDGKMISGYFIREYYD